MPLFLDPPLLSPRHGTKSTARLVVGAQAFKAGTIFTAGTAASPYNTSVSESRAGLHGSGSFRVLLALLRPSSPGFCDFSKLCSSSVFPWVPWSAFMRFCPVSQTKWGRSKSGSVAYVSHRKSNHHSSFTAGAESIWSWSDCEIRRRGARRRLTVLLPMSFLGIFSPSLLIILSCSSSDQFTASWQVHSPFLSP